MFDAPKLDLANDLNPTQRAAVEHIDGPAMIIAGAGSGKTRVLTYRLAHLIEQQAASPWELLALTFTNKAAREMRQRIEQLVGPSARNITMGTFHSVFARILRHEADKLGYTSSYTIYDSDDSRNLIKRILKALNVDDKKYKPRAIGSHISLAKNKLIDAREYARSFVEDEFQSIVAKTYLIYSEECKKANAMDFDDILFNMARMLQNHSELLHKYQHKWKYIMVDEYQDTNEAQYIITKKLAAVHENIVVVGDDAQSIYSFRGANIQNILNFQRDYPDLELFKLEQNYRSTQNIVEAANAVIANNEDQIPKKVFSARDEGQKIALLRCANEQEEAMKIVDNIREQKMMLNFRNSDFCLLYRTNAQSRALEESLRRANISYRIFGGQSFYQRKEIKDVIAYLKLIANPMDEVALRRIINVPTRGIGNKTQEEVFTTAQQKQLSVWEVVKDAQLLLQSRGSARVQEFGEMIAKLQAQAGTATAAEMVSQAAQKSGILKTLHAENTPESLSRWENVQELINAAQEFTEAAGAENASLENFLAEVSLISDLDQNTDETDYVSLMTVHMAKGLEFRSVFVTGMEEGLFPSFMSLQERTQLEEERRLFYVAVTRAEERLAVSFADTRMKYGERQMGEASRFLREIPEEYYALVRRPKPVVRKERSKRPSRSAAVRPNKLTPLESARRNPTTPPPATPIDPGDIEVGKRVEHAKFGVGVVARLEPDRVVIDFPNKPGTTLLLKFAKLKVVD